MQCRKAAFSNRCPLAESLGLHTGIRMAAFVGAGGKTSSIFQLASELAARGQTVLVTTTTRMFLPKQGQCDRLVLSPDPAALLSASGLPRVTFYADHEADGKAKGVSFQQLEAVASSGQFDVILVEADGSRRLPVKAPAAHEPAVPASADMVVGVIGLDCLFTPNTEGTVHRPALFAAVTGIPEGAVVTEAALVRLACAKNGLFRHTPPGALRVLLLNKAETPSQVRQGIAIAQSVLAAGGADRAVVGSVKEGTFLFRLPEGESV